MFAAELDQENCAASLPGFRNKSAYEKLLFCNRCGFCTSSCPTYLATGDEGLSPRGRNQAFRALLEGRLGDASRAERLFSTCLQCGICTSICFSEVPTAKLMSAARQEILKERGRPLLLKLILRDLLPRPRLLRWTLRVLFAFHRLGLTRFLNHLGLIRFFLGARWAAASEMADDLPITFLRERLAGRGEKGPVNVLLFVSCGSGYLRPSVGESTATLLDRSGFRWRCASNVCCGLPGVNSGDLEGARALARKNISELENDPNAMLLVDDSSCASALKDYPSWFDGDDEETVAWRRRAEAVSRRVKDLSEWLAENWQGAGDRFRGIPVTSDCCRKPVTVAYHDPCKARYAEKVVEPPRVILNSLAEVDLREVPEAEQCCGGGGTTSFLHPDVSNAVLGRKLSCIESTGTALVLTSSISCLLQLASGLRKSGSKTVVQHLSEFLANSDPK